MADLQTELFTKVLPKMKLNELKFDDDVETTAEVKVETDKPTKNQTELIWRYIRDNPGCSARDITCVDDYKNVATRINQLVKRGAVRQDKTTYPIGNYVIGDTYKVIDKETRIKMMRAARGMKKAKGNTKEVAKKVTTKSSSNILDGLSVVEARALYDQLKKIFGG